jgi:release factor glutamine methyltransferase
VAIDALAAHPISPGETVLDLGTGSGALAIEAASRSTRVVAVDINPEAVRCARINALLNTLDNRIDVRLSDLFEAVAGERFDLIVCNPPFYRGDAGTEFERALLSPDFAERLTDGLVNHLNDGGRALVVVSSDGDEAGFLAAFRDAGLEVKNAFRKDLVSEVVTAYRLDRYQVSPDETADR